MVEHIPYLKGCQLDSQLEHMHMGWVQAPVEVPMGGNQSIHINVSL